MKNFLLFVLINSFCFGYAYSQTRERYAFDNFKIKNGVQITSASRPKSGITPPAERKTVPVTLVNKGVWIRETPQGGVRSDLVKKTVPFTGKSLNEFTTGDAIIDFYIADSSARYDIDPLLIYAQMRQESGFKRRATSYKGARGVMQLMPATAIRFGVTNIYDPQQNINAGVKYMRWLLNAFDGNLSLALAGYNAGEGAVMKYGNQIPPYAETRQYVKRILAHYHSIKSSAAARNGMSSANPSRRSPR